MRLINIALCAGLLVSGCGSIEHYESPRQPIGTSLTAGIGDVVLRIEKSRDLQNIAGKADIWGRKTLEGIIEVRYMGTEPDGTRIFARRDTEISTNETTVTRMGFVPMPTYSHTTGQTNMSGSVGRAQFNGTATNSSTTTGTTFVPVAAASVIPIPAGDIVIRLPQGQSILRVSGHVVRIMEADGGGITYQLERP